MSQLHQVSELDQRHCWYSLEIYILYFLLLPFLWNPPSKLANLQTEDLEGPGFNRRNKLYYGGSTLNVHLYSVLYLKIQWKAFFSRFIQIRPAAALLESDSRGDHFVKEMLKYLIRKVHCSTAAGYQCLKRKMLVDFQSRNIDTISLQYQYKTITIPYNI